jgi:hypothetical protein
MKKRARGAEDKFNSYFLFIFIFTYLTSNNKAKK